MYGMPLFEYIDIYVALQLSPGKGCRWLDTSSATLCENTLWDGEMRRSSCAQVLCTAVET